MFALESRHLYSYYLSIVSISVRASSIFFNRLLSVLLAGSGSTPLHYAACGGNAQCCQVCFDFLFGENFIVSLNIEALFIFSFVFLFGLQLLIAKGASLSAENANGYVAINIYESLL